MATVTCRVDFKLAGVWTDVTNDVLRGSIRHGHGINGNGPLDVVAGPGDLHFMLQNFAKGSRPVGYYSPGHANVRANFDYGIGVRVVYNDGSDHTRFIGKIAEIDPDADPNGRRCVSVVAYDGQQDLIDASVRAITPQVNQLESALISAVLDSLPSEAQPLSRSIATGLDTVPFAFDKIGTETKAVTAILDAVKSSLGIAYTTGAGVFTYKTRQTRFTASSIATLTDAALITSFSGPTSREGSYNVVRGAFHPKHTTAAIVLWSYTGSTPQVVRAGETVVLETPYRDPNQTSVEIGASAITAPVAGTDYVGNASADGLGAVLTGNLVLTGTTSYTTYTKWTLQNTGTQDIYLGGTAGTWRIRGTGIFDDGEQTVEARSAQPYGERVLVIDLPLQADRHIAQGIASLIVDQRANPTNLPSSVGFTANRSTTLMTLAMAVEPGDIVTISNAMTGVSSATCCVQRIEYEYLESSTLNVRLSVAPTSSLTAPPTAPTGLAVATVSDTELSVTWTNTDVTAETAIYSGGVLLTYAAPAATSVALGGLTRATDYPITLKHVRYALIYSTATAPVTGRPTVVASGGTVTTPGDGYKWHTFTTSGTFTITKPGRINIVAAGGGGGGGGGGANAPDTAGGGGGGGGGVDAQTDNDEPAGAHAVVIGAGGSGGATNGTNGNDGTPGTDTTYRTIVASGRGGGLGGGTIPPNGQPGGALAAGGGAAGGGGGGGGNNVGAAGGVGFNSTGGTGSSGGGNAVGGGGGGGANGNGGNASNVGGSAGAALSTFAGSFGAGGIGGRGALGQAAGGANTGIGGGGGDSVTNGYNGGSGKLVIRYLI